MHAQTLEATEFWARPRDESSAWISNYQRSLQTRHRIIISRAIRECGATSVLEIGCHCGPNLLRIATDQPRVTRLLGYDVNEQAVEAGRRWAQSVGLGDRIQIEAGTVPAATRHLPDRSFDVVLSCYTLAYIAPGDLAAMLWEMGRLAKHAMVIAEPMTSAHEPRTRSNLTGYVEWAHNYQTASRWLGTWSDCVMRSEPVSPPVDQLDTVLIAERG